MDVRSGLWRSRWAAIGAAVAVTFGAGGLVAVNAAGGVDSTVVLTDPVRVLDSRDPVNVGLNGPFASQVSQKLAITGSIPTTRGTKTVVPAGATGVLLNVTAVGASANGFISIRPGDATGAPSTSSLNFDAGSVVPNAVLVALPTSGSGAGQIDITYDAYGASGPSTDILIDVVGYSSAARLDALQAELANRYTKSESDARFVPHGEIVMGYGQNFLPNGADLPGGTTLYTDAMRVSGGNGTVQLNLDGPDRIGGVDYGLKSVSYCVVSRVAPAVITYVRVYALGPLTEGSDSTTDFTDRSANGCYSLAVNNSTASSFNFALKFAGGGGQMDLRNVTATWAPASAMPLLTPDQSGSGDGGIDPSVSGSAGG